MPIAVAGHPFLDAPFQPLLLRALPFPARDGRGGSFGGFVAGKLGVPAGNHFEEGTYDGSYVYWVRRARTAAD